MARGIRVRSLADLHGADHALITFGTPILGKERLLRHLAIFHGQAADHMAPFAQHCVLHGWTGDDVPDGLRADPSRRAGDDVLA